MSRRAVGQSPAIQFKTRRKNPGLADGGSPLGGTTTLAGVAAASPGRFVLVTEKLNDVPEKL